MAEQEKLKLTKTTFDTLCKALEHHDWHFKKDEENLTIECGAQGDDLPMEITIVVDLERMLIILMSHLPFVMPDDKRIDAAVAVSAVNYALVDGSFDYDIKSGHMIFRMSNSFRESLVGEELFMYMILVSCHTIDEYNDKFLMLSKGMLSLEQFIEKI